MTNTFSDKHYQPASQSCVIALGLLDDLDRISSQAEPLATALRGFGLDPAVLEQLRPGAGATPQRITCRLETAADAMRGLG